MVMKNKLIAQSAKNKRTPKNVFITNENSDVRTVQTVYVIIIY